MMWTGILATRNVILGTAVGLALVGWGGSSAASSDSDSDSDSAQVAELCEAEAERAAGRYSNCLLLAEAKAAVPGFRHLQLVNAAGSRGPTPPRSHRPPVT